MPTNMGGPTPAQFVAKWSRSELSERAASQEHFIDLCRLLGQPTPAEHDATGAEYTFEKGVTPTAGASKGAKGDRGFADVWWRGKFAWEYKRKGKYKDLSEAYQQLLQYREALENPPLLVVSDISRTEIHTNFTGTVKQVHVVELANLTEPPGLNLLRRVFTEPDSFKPQVTTENVTQEVAADFKALADSLRKQGHEPQVVAHFLMKCMFCLFAEDIQLLPGKLFTKLLQRSHDEPQKFRTRAADLFAAMRTGGEFAMEAIPFFNGGLFDAEPPLPLGHSDIGALLLAATKDWASVEPSIFGTLFERLLDPGKRAQIGAHYTGRDDIMLVVGPVVMVPLRREWDAVRAETERLIAERAEVVKLVGLANLSGKEKAAVTRINARVGKGLQDFQQTLSSVRVLDPACGSGNFLYVALQQLLSLEKEIINFAARPEIALGLLPSVRPTRLYGIEVNPYAAELAQVVIWIGYLQWMRDNGFVAPRNPVLDPLETIENRDAIVDFSDPRHPTAARWPEAEFIVGNPPFLGNKLFRQNGLNDEYIDALYRSFDLNRNADLCCYWFELGRRSVELCPQTRVGLLATQGIRGGDARDVLERIKRTGDIFAAWSDREWVLEGANVHVSIIAFDGGSERQKCLDGQPVQSINENLTSGVRLTEAVALAENRALSFVGGMKKGPFDVSYAKARQLLAAGGNPNGRSNSEVLKPWINGLDITRRPRGMWIVDFAMMPEPESALYEAPFGHVRQTVKPERDKVRNQRERARWWLHARAVTDLRDALAPLSRYIVTPRLAKHRLFVFMNPSTLSDGQLVVFARSDDYFLGVLQSSVHESWALRMGTQLEDRPRYTPTTTFETFPLPWPPGKEPAGHSAYRRAVSAAAELNERRERWLDPPEWIAEVAAKVDAIDTFSDVPADTRSLIRRSAINDLAGEDRRLQKRTLTKLYNERPTWLKLAHNALDRAVLAAYAATDPEGGWQEDWAEAWLETGAGQPLSQDHPLRARRVETDQRVLSNLLRLNKSRCHQGGSAP